MLQVFWSLGCPVCQRQKPWLEALEARFPGLAVESMELSQTPGAPARFEATAKR